MPIAVLVIAIIAYVYAMSAAPRFRIPGGIGGAFLAAGLGWYFFASPSETERAADRITADQVVLDQVTLDRTVRGATLRGRVLNSAEAGRLREVTIDVRLRDCPPEETNITACPIIGEATAIARIDVPPGQLRGFSAHYVFPNLPAVTGVLRWDHAVTALRAT